MQREVSPGVGWQVFCKSMTPNILLLEDNPDDAHLICSVLAETGQVLWVNSRALFEAELIKSNWDVVLIDHTLPGWSGMAAVKDVRALYPKLPIIVISGVKDDTFAAEAIRAGAADFVFKGHLDRLALVVVRVVNSAAVEDQLVRAQRLDAVGSVLSGMMHDLNGLMTLLPGAIGVVRQKLGVPGQVENCKKWLDVAESTTARVMDMMSRMRVFLHGDQVPYGRLNVCRLLRELVDSVSVFLPKEIEVTLGTLADDLFIQGNSSEIYQVMLNLISNAQDAMPQGGRITIRATVIRLRDYPMSSMQKVSGDFVQIGVADTGYGMTKEVKAHLFEPLFTTKERGTGIGLSTSLRVIRGHHGHIEVLTELKKGSTFLLYFPVINGHGTTTIAARGDGRLLLLVDDEKTVLEALKAVLESANYRVLSAMSGAEALATYKSHADEIDCVLTDLSMPGENGHKLIAALRALNQALRIIIITGSSKDIENTEANAVLYKPITPATLFAELSKP